MVILPSEGALNKCVGQTSLIRASLIRMPHNPNRVPGNLLSVSIYNDSEIRMFHNPNTF